MGFLKPDSPPPPPDPRETSAAQTGTNIGTAIANSMMGMVDQYTPYGNRTFSLQGGGDMSSIPGIQEITNPASAPAEGSWHFMASADSEGGAGGPITPQGPTSSFQVGDQTFASRSEAEAYRNNLINQQGGYYSYTDPYTGETYQIPRFESTVELNPQQQATLDASQQAQTNLAELASDRSDFLLGYLPQTESLTDQIGGELYDMGRQRIDPRFAEQEEALRTRLANQGIVEGSTAFDRAMGRFEEGRNDAYNQLLLQGRGQALSEINTPINQITALLSGSQVSNPQTQFQQPAQIPTTDNAGIINTNYQQQLGAWQQQNANRSAMMGGLFGAGATLLGAPQGSILGGWV